MYKIKFVDNTECEITKSVAGIDCLTVTTTHDFTSLRQVLTIENLAEVRLYKDNALTSLYEGFTKVSPYNIACDGDSMIITVTFSKPEVAEKLEEAQEKINDLQNTVAALQDMFVMML